jgi:hypothetical protein
MLMVIAAINIHHFIVDAFIWRFSKGGRNRRIVDGAAAAPGPALALPGGATAAG